MTLAVVRSLSSVRGTKTSEELEDFEQELLDRFALAAAAAGCCDSYISGDRAMVFEFLRFLGRPVWTASAEDADRFLHYLRHERRHARSTVADKAGALSRFYTFAVGRYQAEIHALTGYVISQPIDEFNRPSAADYATVRVPPSEEETERLFAAWRDSLAGTRKFLPAARDYLAASLWRRAGLRIQETAMLDNRDWRRDLGEHGKLHIRFGKGSRGRGPKPRLVPAINSVDLLLDWWVREVRHQFGEDWADPDAPLLPSERRDADTGRCLRAGTDALRSGLEQAVKTWLPSWQGQLTPHRLRHFCASSLYAHGLDLKAIQELLGHEWLSTTTRYVHVCDEHIEHAWADANDRVATRLLGGTR
ncbi:tyrosine-type recombinase/integrase [Streptomyces mauvecolor]|uniref:tyrosine-type recombinase/integrase n=1 Tax=Streptomyces sp. HUAS TT7 TaxID=3447507 RepID=UPI003F658D15